MIEIQAIKDSARDFGSQPVFSRFFI